MTYCWEFAFGVKPLKEPVAGPEGGDDDPGFVDWQNMNFTLKQDAPVFENIPGFRVFGFDRIGARAPPEGVETMGK